MKVLGIESSCDETAAAVVRDDGTVLADVVASQIAVHAPYGGVVPELASRAHMTNLVPVVRQALSELPGGLDDVDAIAVTQGPGLVGALLVGLSAAKAVAWSRGLPLVGVNHLDGHLLSVFLRWEESAEPPPTPFVALLASGGHTALYRVAGHRDVTLLGQTRDDAAGEAFDKVAKLLGLGYPGGPVVDRRAAEGDPRAIELPTPMVGHETLDFSFAGLKTALAHRVRNAGAPATEAALNDICASFQRAAVEVLVQKSLDACAREGVDHLVLTGGVAANRGLRARARELSEARGLTLHVPPFRSCTDNAAMIAYAGARRLIDGDRDDYDLRAYSRDPGWRRGRVV